VATDKFSFWIGYRDALRKLEPSDGYRLVMAMCDYAFDGIEPDFTDSAKLDLAWQFVRDQVGESVEISRRNAEKGRKSGEARRKKSGKPANEQRSNSVQTTVRTNGMERNGMESVPLHGTVAGFASAPSGAGSPADADEEFRRSFMRSQAMRGGVK